MGWYYTLGFIFKFIILVIVLGSLGFCGLSMVFSGDFIHGLPILLGFFAVFYTLKWDIKRKSKKKRYKW